MHKRRTHSAIAADHGISLRTLQNWKAAGLDVHDDKAVKARVALVNNSRAEAEDMAAAKLRKLTAQADREQTRAARERGELVPAAGISRDGHAAGMAVRQSLEKLAIELPPALAGRDAAEVSSILRREFRSALQRLSESPVVFNLQLTNTDNQ